MDLPIKPENVASGLIMSDNFSPFVLPEATLTPSTNNVILLLASEKDTVTCFHCPPIRLEFAPPVTKASFGQPFLEIPVAIILPYPLP
ncbi:hypothetical protein D3C74_331970 [compost metagenome]